MSRRILVTGADGFVGKHLMAILSQTMPEAAIEASRFDVTDREAVDRSFGDLKPDICVHLAAVAAIGTAQNDPQTAWRVNLHGTLSIADAILSKAPTCTLIFASSADAYGRSFASGRPLDEDAVLAPMNIYGATKAAADLALGAMVGQGLRVIRMRAFNHTGPGQTPDFAVPAFAEQIAKIAAGKIDPVMTVGALDPQRDFLDVRDVSAAYAACAARAADIPTGTIFNIASGIPRRVGDILNDLLRLAGVSPRIDHDAARFRPSDIPLAYGDPSAIKNALGWAPKIDWQTTLNDVLMDWKQRVAS